MKTNRWKLLNLNLETIQEFGWGVQVLINVEELIRQVGLLVLLAKLKNHTTGDLYNLNFCLRPFGSFNKVEKNVHFMKEKLGSSCQRIQNTNIIFKK